MQQHRRVHTHSHPQVAAGYRNMLGLIELQHPCHDNPPPKEQTSSLSLSHMHAVTAVLSHEITVLVLIILFIHLLNTTVEEAHGLAQ